ncbi:MAG: hypothetical protein ACKOUD_04455 [Rhodoluna sp.]
MLGPKTALRTFAALTICITASTASAGVAEAAPSENTATIKFLSDQFVGGKTLDGFTPGTPDYGFTLEAMLQRKAGGQKIVDQMTAIKATLADSTVLSKSVVAKYAYNIDKTIKPGVAGKFLFTSMAIGVPNAPLRNAVVADLKKVVANDGTIASGNSFDYAWAILGLASNHQERIANLAAVKLSKLSRPDGGFGLDQTGDTLASSPDATGIALQALALAKKSASKSQAAAEQQAIVVAAKYLRTVQVTGNHWESFGDVDVNGTAYAAMGLKAAGANVTSIQTWLKSRVASTGGLITPWSNGRGDVFATAQGVVALLGSNYLNLLGK